MPKYKLIYFPVMGRAELTRLLFAQAGVEYEDHRLASDTWPTLKPTMPTGTLPVLEVDGKRIAQSQAIARYVARELKLAGDNNLEMAQCEQVLETFVDITTDMSPMFVEKDEVKKAEMKKSIYEEKTKIKLKYIENMLAANGGEFFVGKKCTIADLGLMNIVDRIQLVTGNDLKDFPKLVAHKEKVGKEPRIAAWLQKRPKTPY
ncbi:hematopoietic prostaglandin D synthase-like [Amphiura filiformis]|uniref:hematopoietic prostaglandin D synthase-like n=1 Tax=Amphiura filiformis TaxID=82378 RepID=UPI003B223649